MANEVVQRGFIARALDALQYVASDGSQGLPNGVRLGRDYSQYVMSLVPDRKALCDEGAYFTAMNPTIGTGIQLNANVTSFSDTNALFVLQNTASAGGKRIHLDFVRLLLTGTAPTATTLMHVLVKTDAINRFPTTAANLTKLAPQNTNQDSGIASIAAVASYANAGAMTIPASNPQTSRFAARAAIATGLGITGDEYKVQFGSVDSNGTRGGAAARAADLSNLVAHAAPVAIGPGQSAAIHMWWLTAATTAATFEYELGWIER